LFSGSADNNIIVWNVENGEYLYTLVGHTAKVKSLEYEPEGPLLISGSSDGSVIVWDLNSRKLKNKLNLNAGEVVHVALYCFSDRLESFFFLFLYSVATYLFMGW
jgi:WD40 repeat protein